MRPAALASGVKGPGSKEAGLAVSQGRGEGACSLCLVPELGCSESGQEDLQGSRTPPL